MSGSIQRFPSVLLPLLSIKSADTPSTLLGEVAPSIEMLPLYLVDRLASASNTLAAQTNPATVKLIVPAGEFWYLWGIQANANTITVGSVVSLSVGIQDAGGNGNIFGATPATAATTAGQQVQCPGAIPNGLILPPGASVIANLDMDPGAGVLDLVVRALFARLTPNA